MTSTLHRALPLVRLFAHVLLVVLLGIAFATALVDGPDWRAVGSAAVFLCVHAVGLTGWVRGRPDRLPLWGAALSVAWLLLVLTTPMGVWLAFPLFFLALDLLPLRRALPVVGVLTVVAIGGFARHSGEWTVGAVLGPAIGALVATALVLGLRIGSEESLRRGQAEERERFSREVHDTLAQGLSSIHLLLGAAEAHVDAAPEKARALIGEARRVASQNLEEARRLVRAQGPADLAERSLTEALGRVVDTAQDPRAILRVDGDPVALPGTHDVALLRIAQEALTNATRHAQASHLAVTLTYRDDEVALDVVDDGNGAVVEGAGFGLGSMRARAEELGGLLTVEPTPGHGTAIAVRLPLEGTG